MNLQLDLHSDWIDFHRSELTRMGYAVPTVSDPHKLSVLYFNALFRLVRPKPRKIWKSRELQCPSEFTSGLKYLEQKVIQGDDLNPHLSRKIVKLDYNDALLNDWGIYHFHLESKFITTGKTKGLIKGTKTVLLARVTETDFYEICTVHHKTWADLDWIEIIHGNWPESVEKWKLRVKSLSFVRDNSAVVKSREAQINSPIQTKDGTIYHQFGGGYAMDGTSFMVVFQAKRHIKMIKQYEKWVRNNTAVFINDLKQRGYDEAKPLKGKFTVDEKGWYAYFPEWAYRIKLFAYSIPTTT